jgi:hypothetical protein
MAVDDHFARHWPGFFHLIYIGNGKRQSDSPAIELMMVGPRLPQRSLA